MTRHRIGIALASIGAALLVVTAFVPSVLAVSSPPPSQDASFVLDGVRVQVHSPFLPTSSFVTSGPGDATQVAHATTINPWRNLEVVAIPFGTAAGGEALPPAQPGGSPTTKSSLRDFRTHQGGRIQDGPVATIFGQQVTSQVTFVHLAFDSVNNRPAIVVEWVTEAGPRMWLTRVSKEQLPGENSSAFLDSLRGLRVSSSNLNSPSTVATRTTVSNMMAADEHRMALPSATAATPTWWNGDCDTNNYQPRTGAAAYARASYNGVAACFPRPFTYANGSAFNPGPVVQFFSGAVGEYEWQCVELSMRFMYLQANGTASPTNPYSANGSQVVGNYNRYNSNRQLTVVKNDGAAGHTPTPGDVLSYGPESSAGHTSVITATSAFDASGNGSVTVLEQNANPAAQATLKVVNWVIQGKPYAVSGWLHNPSTPQPSPGPTPSPTPTPTPPSNPPPQSTAAFPSTAWGQNALGQLGNGATADSLTPTAVRSVNGATALAGGAFHSLAINPDGSVWGWGSNARGQLGDATTLQRLAPAPVWAPGGASYLLGATAIAAGYQHSLALRSDGSVVSWGANDDGQLGNNTLTDSPIAVPVLGVGGSGNLTGITAVAAGTYHSLARKNDGTVWGWGDSTYNQLGTNSSTSTPVQIGGVSGITAIAAGNAHSLALKSDGTVWAWGRNTEGQLGTGSTSEQSNTPSQVTNLTGVTAISAGLNYGLALKSDGTVWGWGENTVGQLGNNSATNSSVPVQVVGLGGITAIAAAGYGNHNLAVRGSDQTVWAWGDNSNGQLGNGTLTNSAVPVQVNGLASVGAIAAGAFHSLIGKAASNPYSRVSTSQYSLASSDGSTWVEIDPSKLTLTLAPATNSNALITANTDLFASNAGYNQDLGVFVSVNGGADQLLSWRESGDAAAFKSNPTTVQTVYAMTAGTSYALKLKWKTNIAASGVTIYTGAGPINGKNSPIRLTAQLIPTGSLANPMSAVSTAQYGLASSDGSTWVELDSNLRETFTPTVDYSNAIFSANTDLWANYATYHQDLGIFLSVNGGADQLLAWKEGGAAASFAPRPMLVQSVYALTAGSTYTVKLKWKTNKPASGVTIYTGAGAGASHSPTALTVQLIPASGVRQPQSAVSTGWYQLVNSDGSTWVELDATNLRLSITPTTDTTAILSSSMDAYANYAGYNQSVGIFVSTNGGADQLVAWKEGGGAAAMSPSPVYVHTAFVMTAGNTYTVKLMWKSNIPASGVAIYDGAGNTGNSSPTSLTAQFVSP